MNEDDTVRSLDSGLIEYVSEGSLIDGPVQVLEKRISPEGRTSWLDFIADFPCYEVAEYELHQSGFRFKNFRNIGYDRPTVTFESDTGQIMLVRPSENYSELDYEEID